MATSDVEIANLALAHLGIKSRVSLLTERSVEAIACTAFYNTARDATLRDFGWPFATKFATLQLVTNNPTMEWKFSYRYPVDCIQFRRIISEVRNDSRQSRVPYREVFDDTGSLIYTDRESAQCEYTVKISDPSKFSADFVLAFSFRLANYIAPQLTGGDPFKMGDRAMKLYVFEISRAQANAANEAQPEEDVDSEFIRDRS